MNDLSPGCRRVAVWLEYDGSKYAGWQWQPGRRTVQEVLETALSRVADHPLRVVCAGRTDAGVHALSQVAHFDPVAVRPPRAWIMGGNSQLPDDLRITGVLEVANDFHARTSAIARYYRYTILNRPMASALDRGRITWFPHPLDEEKMKEASRSLIGNHDFSAFRAQGCQSKSPVRDLHFIEISREGDRLHVDICANAFLHHMVRNIVGSLIEVGQGRRSKEWLGEVLMGRDRGRAGVTAPPDGLYFAGVLYPNRFELPRHAVFDRLPPTVDRYRPPFIKTGVSLEENSR